MAFADKLRNIFETAARETTPAHERENACRVGIRLLDKRGAELAPYTVEPLKFLSFNGARQRIAELEAEVITLHVKLGECSPGERDRLIRADRDAKMTYDELQAKWKLGRTTLSSICNATKSKRR